MPLLMMIRPRWDSGFSSKNLRMKPCKTPAMTARRLGRMSPIEDALERSTMICTRTMHLLKAWHGVHAHAIIRGAFIRLAQHIGTSLNTSDFLSPTFSVSQVAKGQPVGRPSFLMQKGQHVRKVRHTCRYRIMPLWMHAEAAELSRRCLLALCSSLKSCASGEWVPIITKAWCNSLLLLKTE